MTFGNKYLRIRAIQMFIVCFVDLENAIEFT